MYTDPGIPTMPIADMKKPKIYSHKGGRSMWGASLEFWGSVADWTLVAALVFGGVAVLASFASSFISGRVTSKVQAEAKTDSERMATELGVAKAEAAKANEGLAKANVDIAEANARGAEANAMAAQANEKAETERLARIKIELKVSPRRIDVNNAKILDKALEKLNIKVCIVSYGGSEPTSYADQLYGIFLKNNLVEKEESGWHRITADLPNGTTGITIFLPASVKTQEEAQNDPLVSALRKANIPVGSLNWGSRKYLVIIPVSIPLHISRDEYVISIGEKPLLAD